MRKTIFVIILTVVALIAWDVYILLTDGSWATISVIMYTKAKEFPVISFAMGFLMGHFFWRQN